MTTKELPQTKKLDISDLLKNTPTKHVLLKLLANISNLWEEIGGQSDVIKLSIVIDSWLTTTRPSLVTWETVITAMKDPIVNHVQKASELSEHLTTVKETLHSFFITLSQLQIDPVKVSQLLFGERCISETTLDEMETTEGSSDEKKTTLLSAIHTAVSSDHSKLKALATVLSTFHEAHDLSERISDEYAQKCPDNEMTAVEEIATTYQSDYQACDLLEGLESENTMEGVEYQQSHETAQLSMMIPRKGLRKDKEISERELMPKKLRLDMEVTSDSNEYASLASNILRCHYGSLAQSLQYPISVAQLLFEEGVISETTSAIIKSTAESLSAEKARFVLLKAVRHAVHNNYQNLEVFAGVLLKQTKNVPCGMAILKDYERDFPESTIPKPQLDNTGSTEVTTISTMPPLTDSSLTLRQDNTKREVQLPRTMNTQFGSIREEFAIAFDNIREAINKSSPPLDRLKRFIKDGYPHLKSRIAFANSIDDVLDVVNDECTLINIRCLESVVKRFDIKEAKAHIQAYKDVVHSFCKDMKASLCLGESFKVTKIPPLLRCETFIFVLDWDPKGCTLEDIKNLLAESVDGNVEIRDIRESKSIVITCFFPVNLTTLLIAKAQETLPTMKKKGLLQLVVGYYTIYDHRRDKEIIAIVEENTKELRSQLELQQTIVTEKESVNKQREMEEQQKIITSLQLQLKDRDKEIMALKQSLKDSKSSLSEQLKEKSSLMIDYDISLSSISQQQIYQSPEDTGNVLWYDDINTVCLTRPWVAESEDVINKLIKERQTGIEWSIRLILSSPESTAVIINNLNKYKVKGLDIENTPLDCMRVSILSEILKTNKTIKRLELYSSSLTGGIKQVSDSLVNNKTLEELVLYNVTGITDDDMPHLSIMLEHNTTLKELRLFNCDITDNGVRYICAGISKNRTLTKLNIGHNHQITSVSTSRIAHLIQTTTSLTRLYLHNTSLNDDDIKTICTSMTKSTTIQKLYLSKQRENYCMKLDSYQGIKDKLRFFISK